MGSKMSQEEFIAKCKSTHSNYYDYSKTVYSGALRKVTITCLKHGDFEQFASHHSHGRGCKKCANEKNTSNTLDFISKAVLVHGGKYEYSKVIYVSATEKVTISCKSHGDFYQTPDKHLQGRGCPICAYGEGILWRSNPELFRESASRLHDNKYDYSKVIYRKSNEKVEIVCRAHGSFWQSPNTHMQGIGCPVCGGNSNAFAKENFVSKSKRVHGEKYDYSKSEYVNANTKVTITCKEHGEFRQIPGSHVLGSGCPSCAKHGFDENKPATFYVYSFGGVIGYGITNDMKTRHKKHKTSFKKADVSWMLLYTFEGLGKDVLDCERYIKKNFDKVDCAIPGFIEESTDISNLGSILSYAETHLTRP